jgi:serine/threonine-protein kinase
VPDLDLTIERAILRCLEREPSNRPPSALAVSAALPGGSPLAAALAAGETPSPEMVAAAGEQSALRAEVGLATLVVAIVGSAALALVADRVLLFHRIPITKSADGLRDRARDVLQSLGYGEPAADSANGWFVASTFLNYVVRTDQRPDRWAVLSTGRAPVLLFWYRTSPQELVPYSGGSATLDDPPSIVPGMRTVVLDPDGRLVQLRAVPPTLNDQTAARDVDWSQLFDAAALPLAAFRQTTPRVNPSVFSDTKAAFEGTMPGLDRPVRVELAAYGGRPVSFSVIGAWNEPAADTASSSGSGGAAFAAGAALVAAVILVGALLLARHNLRSGRGDRRGAMRLATVVFASLAASALIDARHTPTVTVEYARINHLLSIALFRAGGMWLTYVALEPYVRRFWPELLIGWTRLLSGRVRDPLVGREILVGVAVGVNNMIFIFSHALAQRLLGPPPPPEISSTATLSGVRATAAVLLANVPRTIVDVMQVTFIVVLLKALVRRTWLVLLLSCVIIFPLAISGTFSGEQLALDIPYTVIGTLLMVWVLLRFGLLALCVAFFVFLLGTEMPLTADFRTAYAAMSTWLLLSTVALAAFGFYASRGKEPLFGRALLD